MKTSLALAATLLLCYSLSLRAQVAPHDETQSTSQTSPDANPENDQGASQRGANNPGGGGGASGQTEHTLQNEDEAGEADTADEEQKRKIVRWNQYEGPYFTGRFGLGFLYDFGGFAQDAQSKEQFSLSFGAKVRDFRFLLNGKLFPRIERKITWCAGIMYDAPTKSWLIRQTGVMIAVPELWGNFFIGRAKEGFSLNKVMTGYDGWTMERATMNDATVPLLADGIKWLGYSPHYGFEWNLGYFTDILSKGQSFSSYSHQEVARLIWLPVHSDETGRLFHLGLNLRLGRVANNSLRLKSRPEFFISPYFLDTGSFNAKSTGMIGPEVYYRRGSWLFGSEYWVQHVSSKSTGNPLFNGGDAVVTWLLTGEVRTYNTVGGYFLGIEPKRPVFKGGPGAWELVARMSYSDLTSKDIQGGRFARFTPQVNWYLDDRVRLEFAYGYGSLDRFGLIGHTQFFQSRMQLQF